MRDKDLEEKWKAAATDAAKNPSDAAKQEEAARLWREVSDSRRVAAEQKAEKDRLERLAKMPKQKVEVIKQQPVNEAKELIRVDAARKGLVGRKVTEEFATAANQVISNFDKKVDTSKSGQQLTTLEIASDLNPDAVVMAQLKLQERARKKKEAEKKAKEAEKAEAPTPPKEKTKKEAALDKLKESSAPKVTPTASTPVAPVEASSPKTEIAAPEVQSTSPKPEEQKFGGKWWDEKAERWRRPDGKFVRSPTKAENAKLAAVVDSSITKGTVIGAIASYSLKKKELAAREESQENRGMKPAPTRLASSVAAESKEKSSEPSKSEEADTESKIEEKEYNEDVLELLKKIEENTGKKGKKEEKKEEEKEKGGMFSKLFAGLAGVAGLLGSFAKGIGGALKALGTLGLAVAKFAASIGKGAIDLAKKGIDLLRNGKAGVDKGAGKVPDVDASGKKVDPKKPPIDPKKGTPPKSKIPAGQILKKGAGRAAALLGPAAAVAGAAYAGYEVGSFLNEKFDISGKIADALVGEDRESFEERMEKAPADVKNHMASIVKKVEAGQSITEQEKSLLKNYNYVMPKNRTPSYTEAASSVESFGESPQVSSSVTPTPYKGEIRENSMVTAAATSRIAGKMNDVNNENAALKKTEKEQAKTVVVSTGGSAAPNNTTNVVGGGSEGGRSSSRNFARNPESTLSSWIRARYSFT
jgi:hypothetical protein